MARVEREACQGGNETEVLVAAPPPCIPVELIEPGAVGPTSASWRKARTWCKEMGREVAGGDLGARKSCTPVQERQSHTVDCVWPLG